MIDLHINAVKMIRKIRDKQADEFWKNPEKFINELKLTPQKLYNTIRIKAKKSQLLGKSTAQKHTSKQTH